MLECWYITMYWNEKVRFTLGLNAAKNIDYFEWCFKRKLHRIKFYTKNSLEAYLYLLQEWSWGAQRSAVFKILANFRGSFWGAFTFFCNVQIIFVITLIVSNFFCLNFILRFIKLITIIPVYKIYSKIPRILFKILSPLK